MDCLEKERKREREKAAQVFDSQVTHKGMSSVRRTKGPIQVPKTSHYSLDFGARSLHVIKGLKEHRQLHKERERERERKSNLLPQRERSLQSTS